MPDIRLVVWNMEWLNDLFVADSEPPAFRPDDEAPQHGHNTTVAKRRDDLAGVLNEIQPDVLVVVEGPSRADELQLLLDDNAFDGKWQTDIQKSARSQQNVGIAVRTETGKFETTPFEHVVPADPEAFAEFVSDTDDDNIDESYKFERTPLYVEVKPLDGSNFRVLGLHLKSKGIFQAYEWSKWWLMADANRRKIFAQARRLREAFLDSYLTDPATADVPLVVCGDINDGPGLDASERRLFGSGIERLMGTVWQPHLCLRNALFDTLSPREQAELEFGGIATTSFADPIFNNMWHRVWIDHVLYADNQDDQWVTDANVHRKMADGQYIWSKYRYASDHQPVSVQLHT